MLRFLLPAILLVGAWVALFAGAFGDWQGLSESWDRLRTATASVAHEPPAAPPSSRASPTAPPAASPTASLAASPTVPLAASSTVPLAASPTAPPRGDDTQKAAVEVLRQQVADLQAQVAQGTQELASLHANTDQACQELETLRQQQQVDAALNGLRQDQARQAAARAQARRQRRGSASVPAPPATASAHAEPALPGSAAPGPAAPGPIVPAWTQLMAAREVLASGRKQDARNLLATVATQMVFQPVTPGQTNTLGGNRAATAVGEAIRMLDTGDINLAFQAINRAIDITKSQRQGAGSAATTQPAPSYAPQLYAPQPYAPSAGYRFATRP